MAKENLYNNTMALSSSSIPPVSLSFSSRVGATATDAMAPKTSPDSSKSALKRPHSAIQSKGSSPYAKETVAAPLPVGIEQEVLDADLLLPSVLPFKRIQMSEKYPKGLSRGRHWKHLKQIVQAENYHLYPADETNYVNIESPPSMYPAKKYCDISGFVAPYTDPRTKIRFSNVDFFKRIRYLPEEYIQGYLALRNAAVVLK